MSPMRVGYTGKYITNHKTCYVRIMIKKTLKDASRNVHVKFQV